MPRIAGENHMAQATIFIILKTKSTSTRKCDVGQLKSVFISETSLTRDKYTLCLCMSASAVLPHGL